MENCSRHPCSAVKHCEGIICIAEWKQSRSLVCFFLLFSELLPNLLNTLNRPRAKAQRMGLARRTASGKKREDDESRCSRCFPGKKEII